jgi:hypothetical protein
MEYLRDLLAEHKRNRPPPAVLNGWFRTLYGSEEMCTIEVDPLAIDVFL